MEEKLKYKRVLLKLSGEALKGNNTHGFSHDMLNKAANDILRLQKLGTEIGIVIGGGNFWRGKEALHMDRVYADEIGMLATIMNSIALKNYLENIGIKCCIMSSIETSGFTEIFSVDIARKKLSEGYVIIFSGGTGHPYFSTDTAAALRAAQINAEAILFAKNGVDGVYSDDPRQNKNAKKIDSLSYKEIVKKELGVIDLTAATLCMTTNIPIFVFGMDNEDNIIDVVCGKKIGTIIQEG